MTEKTTARPPVVLCILDGWGHRASHQDNAIALAKTPNWTRLVATSPHALLETSGLAVGLPPGQMGNSEVGHMTLGSGRVVMQDLPRIDIAIQDGSLAKNKVLLDFVKSVKAAHGTAHILGLLSPGGVHSHQDQIAALARLIADDGVPVAIHAFLDGRDTPPSSGAEFMARFLNKIEGHRIRVATVGGRYYGMDRDKRWDREQAAFDAMVDGKGERFNDPLTAIEASYKAGKTDEFMVPTVIGDYQGMQDGDGVAMGNFRADRARQIMSALVDPGFTGFARSRLPKFSARMGMTSYSEDLDPFLATLFPADNLTHILGEVVADAGLHQLRIAETEKYAHVTYFFNGGREEPFAGEDRILVPSPKVATYDLQPEMSAAGVTEKLVAAIDSGKYALLVANYANADMVGHSGDLDAAIKAAEAIDNGLGKLSAAVERQGGTLLITADHGNAEMMRDPETGEPHTSHTTGPVPAVLVNPPKGVTGLENGTLADVAPTMLALLGLKPPKEMGGHALLLPEQETTPAGRRAAG